jgi:hypothetical protein
MSLESITRWISSRFSEMDAFSWYLFIPACLFVTWLLFRANYHAITSEWLSTSFFFLKYLIYPHIFPRIPFIGTATRFQVLITCGYIIINTSLLLGENSWVKIGARAANISVVNLIPLLCGPRLSLMAELLGISLRTGISAHQWLGRMVAAQVVVHVVALIASSKSFTWTEMNVFGIVVIYLSSLG